MSLAQLPRLKVLFLFFISIYCLEAAIFTEEEKNWIEKHPIVKVGAGADWAPIDFFENGRHKGISYEYLKHISDYTGLKFDIQKDLWKNNLQKMKAQTIDLLPALYYTDERNNYMKFSKSYFEVLDYFFIRNDINASSMDDLNGKIVAITQGDARVGILKKNYPQLKILTVPSFNDAIDALLEHKADILFDTYATVEYTLKKQSISTIVPFKSHRTNGIMKLYMASHKDNPLLASIISKSISAISHKEKKLIYEKWIYNKSSTDDKATHITLSEQENKWLKKHKTITFAGDPNWLPFEAFDKKGNYTGIVADYLHYIEKYIPLRFNPIQTKDWSETIAHAKVGDIDVISDDIDSAVLQEHYVPIPAYIKSPIVIVMREKNTFINDLEEIDDKKIALIAKYGYNDKVKKVYPDIPFSYEENADIALQSLSEGKIDAVLLSMPKSQYLLSVQGYNTIKIVGKIQVTMSLTLFVKRSKPHLHSILQKVMQELVNTRHLDIFSKWQKIKFAEKVDYTLVYKILALFLFFILATWYWYRKLNYEVLKRKASEAQMSMMIETIPLNVIVSGLDGSVLRANAFSLKTFSVSAEDIYGHNVMEFYVVPEEREDIVKTIQQEGKVKKRIVKFKRFDHSEIDIMISIIPILYDGEKALLSIMVDLTERIKMEEDLREAKESADSANKSKSEFLANMSHEIRTPMNAIIGFTELLNEEIQETRLKGYVKTIKSAGNTLLTLINDILDLSKIEAGKFEINKRATNIFDLSEDVLSIFMMSVRDKGLDLILDIDSTIPKSLLIDDIRLRQILVNIIGNAVKFTQKGFIKLKISALNVDKHLSKLDLQIVVEDTGMGIAKNQLENIFHSFEQQLGQDNYQFGGTGLGLSISKRLVEMMGGKVEVESIKGKGAKFSVYLYGIDISSIQMLDEKDNQAHLDVHHIRFKPAKLLVVDDIEDNRDLIVQNFENSTLTVITAQDGVEAIEQYKKEKPDVILMDIRMPNMNGYRAAEEIKRLSSSVPIIALTASIMKDEYERAKSENFDAYLRKPILRDELYLTLSHFLEYDKVTDIKDEEIDTNPKILLRDASLLNKAQILNEMHRILIPLHQQAAKSNNIEEIKIFTLQVHTLAQKYDIDFLADYVEELNEAIETFDISQIQFLLRRYLKIQDQLELL